MDEDEIDSWYEEEKQKHLDEFIKRNEDGKDKQESERKYKIKLAKTISEYNKKMISAIDKKRPTRKKNILEKIMDKFKHK